MKCYDKLSGESFEIDGVDVVSEIEQWVADGIDSDSGVTGYDVETEDGDNYAGEVDPIDYQDDDEEDEPLSGEVIRHGSFGPIVWNLDTGETRCATQADMDSLPVGDDLDDDEEATVVE